MTDSVIYSLFKAGIKDKKRKSSEKATGSQPAGGRPRSNTLDLLLRAGSSKPTPGTVKSPAASQPRPRAHAPLGLAFISLSDANLNRIREDAQLPLSRKDIQLSGPLALEDPEDKIQGIYVQNLK